MESAGSIHRRVVRSLTGQRARAGAWLAAAPRRRALQVGAVTATVLAVAVISVVAALTTRRDTDVVAHRPSSTPTTTSPSPTPTPTTSSPTPTATPTPSRTRTPKPTRAAQKATPRPSAPVLAPMSISVPTIDVSGRLTRTRATSGVVNPPGGTIGWVSGYGRVRPGERGTAVIAGHVTDGGDPDVFYNLQDLDRGDKIYVVDEDGTRLTYTVTSTRVATKESVSRDPKVWGANAGVRRIALITCDDENGYRADGHRVSNFVAIAEVR